MMARRDWKMYYGVVMHHKGLGRTFVNGQMYNNRDDAHIAAMQAQQLGFIEVLGVVGVKGRTAKIQKELWARVNVR